MSSDDALPGDIVILTQAYEDYVYKSNPRLSVSLVNRLAKLEDIIDWESEKGKIIKEARIKSGKWGGLPIEENKYILSIFYHELTGRNGKRGVIQRGVSVFKEDPKTGTRFFEKVPGWLYKEILRDCVKFDVEKKENVP